MKFYNHTVSLYNDLFLIMGIEMAKQENIIIENETQFKSRLLELYNKSSNYKNLMDLLFKIYELKNIYNHNQFFFNNNEINNFSDLFVFNEQNVKLMNDLANNKFKCYNITFEFPFGLELKNYECFVILNQEHDVDFSNITQYFYKKIKRGFRFVETNGIGIAFNYENFKILKKEELNCIDFYQKLIPIALSTFKVELSNYKDLNPNASANDIDDYIQKHEPIVVHDEIFIKSNLYIINTIS